jgi:hypothetical protein
MIAPAFLASYTTTPFASRRMASHAKAAVTILPSSSTTGKFVGLRLQLGLNGAVLVRNDDQLGLDLQAVLFAF